MSRSGRRTCDVLWFIAVVIPYIRAKARLRKYARVILVKVRRAKTGIGGVGPPLRTALMNLPETIGTPRKPTRLSNRTAGGSLTRSKIGRRSLASDGVLSRESAFMSRFHSIFVRG